MWAGQLSITLLLLTLASRFPISRKTVTREALPRAYRERAKSRARDFFGWTPQNPYYTPLCAVPPPFALDALRSLVGRPRYARQTPSLTALLSSATFAACSFRSVPVRYILVEGYEVQRNENVRLDYSCPFSTRPILNECHNSSGLIGIGILFWIWELKQRIHAFLQERNWRICVPKTTVFDSYRVRLQIYLLTEQPNGLSVRFRSVGLHTPL